MPHTNYLPKIEVIAKSDTALPYRSVLSTCFAKGSKMEHRFSGLLARSCNERQSRLRLGRVDLRNDQDARARSPVHFNDLS
jgi:hypothetical protein